MRAIRQIQQIVERRRTKIEGDISIAGLLAGRGDQTRPSKAAA